MALSEAIVNVKGVKDALNTIPAALAEGVAKEVTKVLGKKGAEPSDIIDAMREAAKRLIIDADTFEQSGDRKGARFSGATGHDFMAQAYAYVSAVHAKKIPQSVKAKKTEAAPAAPAEDKK